MKDSEMVSFCKTFVSLLDRPVKKSCSRDMIQVVENGKRYATEYNLERDFLLDDDLLKKFGFDSVYCKVYAFIRDNQHLF